jgi:hypothetical protein
MRVLSCACSAHARRRQSHLCVYTLFRVCVCVCACVRESAACLLWLSLCCGATQRCRTAETQPCTCLALMGGGGGCVDSARHLVPVAGVRARTPATGAKRAGASSGTSWHLVVICETLIVASSQGLLVAARAHSSRWLLQVWAAAGLLRSARLPCRCHPAALLALASIAACIGQAHMTAVDLLCPGAALP